MHCGNAVLHKAFTRSILQANHESLFETRLTRVNPYHESDSKYQGVQKNEGRVSRPKNMCQSLINHKEAPAERLIILYLLLALAFPKN